MEKHVHVWNLIFVTSVTFTLVWSFFS